MKKQRIYLDTSIFGGLYDEEFKEFTEPLFERVQNSEFEIIHSNITEQELETHQKVTNQLIFVHQENYYIMKTKEKSTKKTFDAVKYMREQRDRISKEIMNLSPEEIVKYFEKKRIKQA